MSALRRRLHSGRGRDAGVSLAELLVVSLVSSILLAALGMLVSSSLAASRETTTHTAATAEARLAMDVVARRLRVAVRPTPATPTSPPLPMLVQASTNVLEFWASIGPPGSTALTEPTRVRYAYDNTNRCLRETLTPPTGPVRSTCLARGTVTPVFRYFQVTKPRTSTNPSPSPVPTAALAPPDGGRLSDADANRVASVQIDLAVTDPLEPTRTVDVRTRVLLVNHHNERT